MLIIKRQILDMILIGLFELIGLIEYVVIFLKGIVLTFFKLYCYIKYC